MATVNGTAGNDSLTGTSGNDTLNGFGGNDTHVGSGGVDFHDGGGGTDTLDLRAGTNVVVNFATGNYVSGSVTGSGSFVGIERILATNTADHLLGAAGGQNLSARGGPDELEGAAGNDTLWGGAGADRFIYREGDAANADQIADFESGSDKIVFDAAALTAIGPAGNFTASDPRFWSSSSGTAHDADDRVIYNTSTRQIFYDADGNGAGAALLIATLQSGATLVATDIEVQGESGGTGQVITGTAGSDTLSGTHGDDTISGLGGNDSLTGNAGADSIRGGDGNDVLVAGEGGSTLAEDLAGDTLDGGLGDDLYIVSGEHDGDVILADPGGFDTVISWYGDWTLGPGLENLTLGDDQGVGADGTGNELDNRIISATEGGTISGLGGHDTLIISGGENTITALGGEGNDTIQGRSSENDRLFGDAGNDLLMGRGSFSTMSGGAGDDVFLFDTDPAFGDGGEVILDFATGSDTLRLDGERMTAIGASGRLDAGDDRFAANDTGTAQDDSDRVVYNTSTGELFYDPDGTGGTAAALIVTLQGAPGLAAQDIEVINGTAPSGSVINGTAGNDTLSGTAGDDTINGLGGNDTILGASGGSDVVDGGEGRDSIEFKAAATSTVVVDYASAEITGGGAGSISFTSIERVVAGNFNDFLNGGAGAQNLAGQSGNDFLWGAAGNDTLWGGQGNDTFSFHEMGAANADRLSDFTSGQDKVELRDDVFTAIGASGNFAAGDARFWASSSGTAHDSNDRVLYNTSTGQLYYDADGNGSGGAQLVATVAGAPTIAATDFVVI